jgi:hypothetical protein
MDVTEQLALGKLVCPISRAPLSISVDGLSLSSRSSSEHYAYFEGRVPILLSDPEWAAKYANESGVMVSQYSPDRIQRPLSVWQKLKGLVNQDHRTTASKEALRSLFAALPDSAVCLSIGGGPTRVHPSVTNVNIGPFPNVDVVGDAHRLPYADDSVDAIHSEAVFEHLYDPQTAAKETHRVLKPGGRAYVCTPFLQAYHGYPSHYQNYTLTGHARLFESVGFRVVESGPCVGPVFTMVDLTSVFLKTYLPYPFNVAFRRAWSTFGMLLTPLDEIIGNRSDAYVMASTTYAILEKTTVRSGPVGKPS